MRAAVARLRAALAMVVTLAAGVVPATAAPAAPAVVTRFISLAPGVPGVLYSPATPGPKAAISIFIMHSSADYLTFSGCSELAERGYSVLCANNSTGKNGVSNDGALDRVLLDAKAGVSWLRAQRGIRTIVLMGHSGGGTVMSAYQMIAEGGTGACRAPGMIWRCPDSLAGLPPADGMMLIDSNWGLAAMTLFSVDPAVKRPDAGKPIDPALDMFAPRNGFAAAGSRYPSAFVRRFLAAEGRRSNAILADAERRYAAIRAGDGPYDDDAPFVVPGAVLLGSNNKLFSQDVGLMAHTRAAWPLIHRDGRVTTGIVPSVRVPENVRSQSPSYLRGALKTTVANYLNSYAIRTTPDFGYDGSGVRGVEWRSTYASPPGDVQAISAPLLVLGMTGHWEYLAAETIFDLAASRDKTLAFVEGADHLYGTCRPCEPTPGAFGDTMKTTYDTIDRWLSMPGRFQAGPARALATGE